LGVKGEGFSMSLGSRCFEAFIERGTMTLVGHILTIDVVVFVSTYSMTHWSTLNWGSSWSAHMCDNNIQICSTWQKKFQHYDDLKTHFCIQNFQFRLKPFTC
jgi:hypothetical protein